MPSDPEPPRWTVERVTALRPWAPGLLSWRMSRPEAFRFKPGHYARVGLAGAGEPAASPVFRPFSMVSSKDAPFLEFVAVLVPGGAFTTRLATLQVGDPVLLEKPAFGFLTVDAFRDGRDLWMLASGTGIGPFVSILQDPEVWRRFERLVVVHSVRRAADLAYRDEIRAFAHDPRLAAGGARLDYVPVVTREAVPGALDERLPALVDNGKLEAAVGTALGIERSRLMICGNPDMAAALRRVLTARGFRPNRRASPGQLAFENYWGT